MKNHILKPQIRENMVIARLPNGVDSVDTCFITENSHPNQRPDYSTELQLGRDFQIRNGAIVSKKVDQIGENFILIQVQESFGKRCKTCRKDDQTGSFCSHCGQFLF